MAAIRRGSAKTFKAGRVASWRRILVQVEATDGSEATLRAAHEIAGWFDAELVGVGGGAGPPLPIDAELGWRDRADALLQDEERRAAEAAERHFREHVGAAPATWRRSELPLHEAMLVASGAVDLIVAPFWRSRFSRGGPRHLNSVDLVLHAGRPVLLAPEDASPPRFRHVVLGWKDTRESRRALTDAIPLMVRAEATFLVEVASGEPTADRTDLISYLESHGVRPHARLVEGPDATVAEQLHRVAEEVGSDLIISGCFSRRRAREAFFGGATRDLLHRPERYLLMSH